MSPAAQLNIAKSGVNMAAAKIAASESKATTAKMHRRSRSGTSLVRCMSAQPLSNTKISQVVSRADFEGRSVRKASLLVRHADTWDCDAITSDQCGGVMESSGDNKRKTSKTASSALNSPRRLHKLSSNSNSRLQPLRPVFVIRLRRPTSIGKSLCHILTTFRMFLRSLGTSFPRYLQMSTLRCHLHHSR